MEREKFGVHCFYGDVYIEIYEGIDLSQEEVMQKVKELLKKVSDPDFKIRVDDLELIDYIPVGNKPPKWRKGDEK